MRRRTEPERLQITEEPPAPPPLRSRVLRAVLTATKRLLGVAVALGLVGGAAAYAYYELWQEDPAVVAERERCVPSPPGPEQAAGFADAFPLAVPVPPSRMRVTVVNSLQVDGLGAQTTAELTQRRFGTGRPRNGEAPPEMAAGIRFGPEATGHAMTLAAHVRGAEPLPDPTRNGTTVELLIGPRWGGLRPVEEAEQLVARVTPQLPEDC